MEKINIVITKEEVDIEDTLKKYNLDLKQIEVILLPTISIHKIHSLEVKESLKRTCEGFYDHCIFLSSNSVRVFFDIVKNDIYYSSILKELKKMKIIVIGPKTKKILEEYGLESKLVTTQKKYSLSEIINYLINLEKKNSTHSAKKQVAKILMPRSAESLKSSNFINVKFDHIILDQVFFYETRENENISNSKEWKKLLRLRYDSDKTFLIFTSPSTVRAFFKILYQQFPFISNLKNESELIQALEIYRIISIGPSTSSELEKKNLDFLQSTVYTINGSLELLFDMINT